MIKKKRQTREDKLEKKKIYYLNNKGIRKLYLEKNKEEIRIKKKEYYQENKSKLRVSRREYLKDRYFSDENFRRLCLMKCRLAKVLKIYTKNGKVFPSEKYGINFTAIIEHLKPFPKNTSLYHIDHIKPLCSFNFINNDGSTNLIEVQKAFAPENHQWLTIKENLSKGGRILN